MSGPLIPRDSGPEDEQSVRREEVEVGADRRRHVVEVLEQPEGVDDVELR